MWGFSNLIGVAEWQIVCSVRDCFKNIYEYVYSFMFNKYTDFTNIFIYRYRYM